MRKCHSTVLKCNTETRRDQCCVSGISEMTLHAGSKAAQSALCYTDPSPSQYFRLLEVRADIQHSLKGIMYYRIQTSSLLKFVPPTTLLSSSSSGSSLYRWISWKARSSILPLSCYKPYWKKFGTAPSHCTIVLRHLSKAETRTSSCSTTSFARASNIPCV